MEKILKLLPRVSTFSWNSSSEVIRIPLLTHLVSHIMCAQVVGDVVLMCLKDVNDVTRC